MISSLHKALLKSMILLTIFKSGVSNNKNKNSLLNVQGRSKESCHNRDLNSFPFVISCYVNLDEESSLLKSNYELITNLDILDTDTNTSDIFVNSLEIQALIHTQRECVDLMNSAFTCLLNKNMTNEFQNDAKLVQDADVRLRRNSFHNGKDSSYEVISKTYRCFRSVNGIYQTIWDLNNTYYNKNLIRVQNIGKSYLKSMNQNQGDDILVVQISNFGSSIMSASQKSNIFFMFAIHAREFATAELGMQFVEYLLESYNANTNAMIDTLLNTTTLHFLLQSNPDGRRQAEQNPHYYVRKNRNPTFGNCTKATVGIDLNRNFPFMWGGLGASTSVCRETFRGPHAASEPETRAIVDYAKSIFPENQRREKNTGRTLLKPFSLENSGIFVDVHSYGKLVMFPWSYKNRNTANKNSYLSLATKLTSLNKYKLAGPLSKHYLYEASGDTTDFMYGHLGVMAFTFEIGNRFYESCHNFRKEILPHNTHAFLYMSNVAAKPYKLSFGPDVLHVHIDLTRENSMSIEARVSDKELAKYHETGLNFVTGSQDVIFVFCVLDDYPFNYFDLDFFHNSSKSATSSWFKMIQAIPEIRNYTDIDEVPWTTSLDISSLSHGKHILYVFGVDSTGSAGPLSSSYFDILCTDNSCDDVI